MVFGGMDRHFDWKTVRCSKDEGVLSNVQAEEKDHGGYAAHGKIFVCGTEKAHDKTKAKGEGQNRSL